MAVGLLFRPWKETQAKDSVSDSDMVRTHHWASLLSHSTLYDFSWLSLSPFPKPKPLFFPPWLFVASFACLLQAQLSQNPHKGVEWKSSFWGNRLGFVSYKWCSISMAKAQIKYTRRSHWVCLPGFTGTPFPMFSRPSAGFESPSFGVRMQQEKQQNRWWICLLTPLRCLLCFFLEDMAASWGCPSLVVDGHFSKVVVSMFW